jgi:hypothetical protein
MLVATGVPTQTPHATTRHQPVQKEKGKGQNGTARHRSALLLFILTFSF